MTYEDKIVKECLKEIKKEFRATKGNQSEYRIARNKIGNLRLHLHKLVHLAFREGIYVGKQKKDTRNTMEV